MRKHRLEKNLQIVRDTIRDLVRSGVLEPARAEAVNKALGSLDHAVRVRDHQKVVVAVNMLAMAIVGVGENLGNE